MGIDVSRWSICKCTLLLLLDCIAVNGRGADGDP